MLEISGCNKVIGGTRYPSWANPCNPDDSLDGCYREVLGQLAPVLQEPIGMCDGEIVGCHKESGGYLVPVLQFPEYNSLQELIDNCCEESSSSSSSESSSSSSESSSSSDPYPDGEPCSACQDGPTPRFLSVVITGGTPCSDGCYQNVNNLCQNALGSKSYDGFTNLNGTYIIEQVFLGDIGEILDGCTWRAIFDVSGTYTPYYPSMDCSSGAGTVKTQLYLHIEAWTWRDGSDNFLFNCVAYTSADPNYTRVDIGLFYIAGTSQVTDTCGKGQQSSSAASCGCNSTVYPDAKLMVVSPL
jgi:hypothetical protein